MQDYSLERLRALVVEDNKYMQVLLSTILHGLGMKDIRLASDGADAFKQIKIALPDFIICDWAMSPLDGFDFVRLVRMADDSPNPYMPIIMLTGHTEAGHVVEARDIGVNEFLAKPVSPKSLYERIQALIEQPRPFVRTAKYFGPCRRRRRDVHYAGEERRHENLPSADENTVLLESESGEEAGGTLSNADIDAMFD
ncbi:MAG: response regulator [Alphaproteobacteria bacterium]